MSEEIVYGHACPVGHVCEHVPDLKIGWDVNGVTITLGDHQRTFILEEVVTSIIEDLQKAKKSTFYKSPSREQVKHTPQVRGKVLITARSYGVYKQYLEGPRAQVLRLTPQNTKYLGHELHLRGLDTERTVIIALGLAHVLPIFRTGFIKQFTKVFNDEWWNYPIEDQPIPSDLQEFLSRELP